MHIPEHRIKCLNTLTYRNGPVIYWMSRDQRIYENWALLYAQKTAMDTHSPFYIVFNLVPAFLGATLRQYTFMLEGLKECQKQSLALGVPFILTIGNPKTELPGIIKQTGAGLLVTDFDPLQIKQHWQKNINSKITIPFHVVDTRNIVPCRAASGKAEYAAYTFRPKITKMLPEFLTEIPKPKKMDRQQFSPDNPQWERVYAALKINKNVQPVTWLKPGHRAALRQLHDFIAKRLNRYTKRNDPNIDAVSNLSPYLHFGQISGQRVAIEINKSYNTNEQQCEEFLEQLIVRRELADNFCYYNDKYNRPDCFPDWSRATLEDHLSDPRPYLYDKETLENGETHDDLWNAIQKQLVRKGTMHGYLRMYWAKKILEWTTHYAEAMDYAICFNDTYQLDGRDPNGYAGIAWAIGGVHDRAFSNREIFGKVRYMNYNGCRRKFDIGAYLAKIRSGNDR